MTFPVKNAFFRPWFWLGAGFLVFLFFLLPLTRNYPFYLDEYVVFKQIQKLEHNPAELWAPDSKEKRIHPLYLLIFYLESRLWGPNPTGYFLVLFLFHFLNACLVTRLARALGLDKTAGTVAGLLFLFTSAHYQAMVTLSSTTRVVCLFVSLLAVCAWLNFLKTRRAGIYLGVVLLQTLALFSHEDALMFPVIAALFARNLRVTLPLFLTQGAAALFTLRFFIFSPHLANRFVPSNLELGPKMLSFIELLFRPLLVPEKNFSPSPLLRLIPAVIVVGGALIFFLQNGRLGRFMKNFRLQTAGIGTGWMAVTLFPFIFQPLIFEHATRYLYFPMVGFCLIFGEAAAQFVETVKREAAGKGVFFCYAVFVLILGINLNATAYHYGRYVRFAEEHPGHGFMKEIKQFFYKE